MRGPRQYIPSPNQWLQTIMRAQNLSSAQVGRLTGSSPPQVARWLSSAETIPLEHLLCIAQICPVDVDSYICVLKNCEEMEKALHKSCRRFQELLGLDIDIYPAIRETLDSFMQRPELDDVRLAQIYLHHLIAARFAIRLISDAAAVEFVRPLIPQESAGLLRHPMNHIIGKVLSLATKLKPDTKDFARLSEFRDSTLAHLRKVTLRELRNVSQLGVTGQFSFYFLSRYGNKDDQIALEDLLGTEVVRKDLLVRRLVYSGVIQGSDPELEERYIHELRQDSDFALMSLQFDAFHYGDINLDKDGRIPQQMRVYNNAIDHILRHLKNPQIYPYIQEVESLKLIQIAELVGASALSSSHIKDQLNQLPQETNATNLRKTEVRQELLSVLSRLFPDLESHK